MAGITVLLVSLDPSERDGEEEADQLDEEDQGPRMSFAPFCPDPAALRQRQAERYASKDAARNKGG